MSLYGGASDVQSFTKTTQFSAEHVIVDDIATGNTILPLSSSKTRSIHEVFTSQPVAVMNLTKNLLGSGICALPRALKQGSVVGGLSMLFVVAVVSGGSFWMIGHLCHCLRATSYRDIWARVFGSESAAAVDLCIFLNCFFGCLACVVVLSDYLEKGIPALCGVHVQRSLLTMGCTVVFLLPLSHVKNLAPLKYPSAMGLLVIVYICYIVIYDGITHMDVHRFGDNFISMDSGIVYAMGIYTAAFKAHYNAPAYYRELGCDMAAFTRVVAICFSLAFLVYSTFAAAGFAVFGDEVNGNVLKNYDESDWLALVAWLSMAFCMVCTYPLIFYSGRNSFLSIAPGMGRARDNPGSCLWSLCTIGLVLSISLIACKFTELSAIVSFMGATAGSTLCWTLPAILYMYSSYYGIGFKDDETTGLTVVPGVAWSPGLFAFQFVVFLLGVFSLLKGGYTAVSQAMGLGGHH